VQRKPIREFGDECRDCELRQRHVPDRSDLYVCCRKRNLDHAGDEFHEHDNDGHIEYQRRQRPECSTGQLANSLSATGTITCQIAVQTIAGVNTSTISFVAGTESAYRRRRTASPSRMSGSQRARKLAGDMARYELDDLLPRHESFRLYKLGASKRLCHCHVAHHMERGKRDRLRLVPYDLYRLHHLCPYTGATRT